MGDRLADRLVVERGAAAIGMVIDRAVRINAELRRRRNRVDIRAEEQEFPAEFVFLPLNHSADLLHRVAMAAVLHAIRDDDKQHLVRPILRSAVPLCAHHSVNGSSDGIQQRRAASHLVLPVGHRLHRANILPVVQHLVVRVKQHGRDPYGSLAVPLLVQHGVVSADGVALQSVHRAAAVEDEHQVGLVGLFRRLSLDSLMKKHITHDRSLLYSRFVCCEYRIPCVRAHQVASRATSFFSLLRLGAVSA